MRSRTVFRVVTQAAASESAAQHIAAEVRAELARQRMSIRQYAEQLGVNHLWVNRRISTMQTDMTPDDVEFMAGGLGLPVWKLLPPRWLPRLDSNQQPFGYGTRTNPRRRHLQAVR
jgi:hypothetical protein